MPLSITLAVSRNYVHVILPCLLPNTTVSHAARDVFVSFTEFTEFTEAVNANTDGISKHMLSPYNAHYQNDTFYLVSGSSTLCM